MSPTKHGVAAAIFLALLALAVVGILLEGGRQNWDWDSMTTFGRRGAPLWFATAALSLFATVMAIAAVWQLRLSRR